MTHRLLFTVITDIHAGGDVDESQINMSLYAKATYNISLCPDHAKGSFNPNHTIIIKYISRFI